MSFASLEFLFFFFPIAALIYFILPKRVRNYWLLLTSLFFYIWGEPALFPVLLVSILLNYLAGLLLDHLNCGAAEADGRRGKQSARRKGIFILMLLLNFSALFAAKYLNTVTSIIRGYLPGAKGVIPQTSIVLPLAISFFTFQSVSYLIDIYRGAPAEKNLCSYALFICFFPKLLQGPLMRYSDFLPQLKNRKVTADMFSDGAVRFLTGFNQKILIANVLAPAVDNAFSAQSLSVGMAWLGMLAYSLQLYFDFAAYSDMAVGLGKMFGFTLPENFDFPYAAKSITEFWRRWHITLGKWFRDYLYIPLGGSRVSSGARLALNLLIVWIATGIWHGAGGTFILWGLLHGVFIVFEKLTGLPEWLGKHKKAQLLYHGVVLLAAAFGWMLFRADNLSRAVFYAKALLKLNHNPWRDARFLFDSREYIVVLAAAVPGSFPMLRNLRRRISARGEKAENAVLIVWFLIQVLLAIFSISAFSRGIYSPFLYGRF